MRGCLMAFIGLIVLSFVMNVYFLSRPEPETSIVVEHDTVWRDIVIEKPVAAETINTGRVVYIKIPMTNDTMGSGTIVTLPHHDGCQPHCVADSATIALPIVQKRYDDSLYTAWVSGFEPNLDSILIHQREVTNTITITNTITKPASRFSIGPSVGLGYGIANKKADVFVGITATYNILCK